MVLFGFVELYNHYDITRALLDQETTVISVINVRRRNSVAQDLSNFQVVSRRRHFTQSEKRTRFFTEKKDFHGFLMDFS